MMPKSALIIPLVEVIHELPLPTVEMRVDLDTIKSSLLSCNREVNLAV